MRTALSALAVFLTLASSATAAPVAAPSEVEERDASAVLNTRFITYEDAINKRDEVEERDASAVLNTRFITYEDSINKRDEVEERDPSAVLNSRFITYEDTA
ncbi:hypothetical protein CBS63078_6773 [Aspergillus niger]|uniref:Uncharacterized protein n=2 Tax=Aspergillus TaxID=5052 RepID=A0A370PFN7_ASPPH|nr:hypothetical protein CBS11350_5429 [Aspergillus niger]RDK40982.1 hypothetical protein M752DRAFT_327780 [Aspergillus phoenicis ATCC 13157]KAI2882011.1 hypothetical protein CBS11852_9739 [Aspergillus niger]KAI2900948.1 hypothetical protein CBS63078_6773 [Aspergillus niger]KAI3015161.1 hypothetical protein CBS147345_5061 [Aspergillus niger]